MIELENRLPDYVTRPETPGLEGAFFRKDEASFAVHRPNEQGAGVMTA
jgi:hypothetical protein